tara:strand:+ start:912 stop:1529 length:618 start_codon:yes stop_codon:yes gene_type:complete
MASTTIDLDTELSAVNSILGAIGQAPVTALVYENPEISFIYNLLRDANVDTQAEGWHFNTEKHVKYTPDTNGNIVIANDVLRLDVSEGWTHRVHDVIRRNGKLYDKIDHTYDFSTLESIDLDVVLLVTFENLPIPFRRYITYRASTKAATQLVANPNLVKLLQGQEALARASIMEYECNQGNHSMFGFPEETIHTTYQPWRNLRR